MVNWHPCSIVASSGVLMGAMCYDERTPWNRVAENCEGNTHCYNWPARRANTDFIYIIPWGLMWGLCFGALAIPMAAQGVYETHQRAVWNKVNLGKCECQQWKS
jgi:hypothetical protein